ncbi:hypothetical protein [Streptomyces sp. G1]|nr:hypothetical protein [Streptomyces sp. G1]MCM1976076.1 hypothetical protein [Streptomyces sp. G1]
MVDGRIVVDGRIDGRIVYVEILDRPPMHRASPEAAGRAEVEHADL